MSNPKLNKTEQLNKLLTTYLETKDKLKPNQYGELEIKFGTRNIKKITKNTFDNVIKYLKARNFELNEESSHYLNIKTDTVRTAINGAKNIQEYCRTNNITGNYPQEAITFTEKNLYPAQEGSTSVVNFDDFNFRVAYSIETNMTADSEMATNLVTKWAGEKKFYRLINRFTMINKDYPVKIDLSIVRESRKGQNNLKDSILFNIPEKYEIEIELINDSNLLENTSAEVLDKLLKKVTKYIMCGLQGTNYPISYSEQNLIIEEYMKLIFGEKYQVREIGPKNYLGPSSATLQMSNIIENKDSAAVNVLKNYTVTDKADGDRKLLYISTKGKIYLITTLMEVEFTGAQTGNSEVFNSLIDGEHIKHNKLGEFINLYAAFDIYYIKNVDVRNLLFTQQSLKELATKFRLPLLGNVVKNLKATLVNSAELAPINIRKKIFYETSESETIFDACNELQTNINADQYEYETDGFIFTPSNLGVGINKIGDAIKNTKSTWKYSLKWKPAKYNTVDFLITTKKLQSGLEYIGNIFEAGLKTKALDQIVQYKTIILRVGYNEREHGYINPCENILKDEFPSADNIDDENTYKPVQFFPSNPPDSKAGITNIELKLDNTNTKQMFTESNEIVEDNTIVEFRYAMDNEESWRWIPLRVRYDKTAEYNAGHKQYGNAYHVAESNWRSIHNPITIEMLTTGNEIPEKFTDDEIYYNSKKGVSHTRALRDFHNLFVKNKLITSVSEPGNTLIDYAVGKAGDMSKWISAQLSFVFGIDLFRDNIYNKLDGACARYLTAKKKYEIIPDALFVQGNTAKNIKAGTALYTEKGKTITNAIFGEGSRDEKQLEKGILKAYGKAVDGFNISSIQFAIHYMFENTTTLHNFLTNIAECTKLGGYFIGTSLDGKEVFKLLKDKKQGESVSIWDKTSDNKLLELTKQYKNSEFPDTLACLGYGIDVFQESINKTFTEYLVNYDYLISVIGNYGFVPINDAEAKGLGLVSGIGSFRELFALMELEIKSAKNPREADKIKKKYRSASDMTDQQKEISFLNKYFIFKKTHNVDIKEASIGLTQISEKEQVKLAKESLKAQHTIQQFNEEQVQSEVKPIKKLKSIKLSKSKQSKQSTP